jgi:hypothetical protein
MILPFGLFASAIINSQVISPLQMSRWSCQAGVNRKPSAVNSQFLFINSCVDSGFRDIEKLAGSTTCVRPREVQKCLCLDCHSELDPESRTSELDSRFRGNDGLVANVKKCQTRQIIHLNEDGPFLDGLLI